MRRRHLFVCAALITAAFLVTCDIFDYPLDEYHAEQTGKITLQPVREVKNRVALGTDGTVRVAPGEQIIIIPLDNPRGYMVREEELVNLPGDIPVRISAIAWQNADKNTIEIKVTAEVEDVFSLRLTVKTAKEGRILASREYNIACVEFDTQLAAPQLVLDQIGTYIFPSKVTGYTTAPNALPVMVSNNGTAGTGPLTVALSGDNHDSFTLSPTALPSIAAGDSDTFTVLPKTGLAITTHNATVTVSGSGISAAFTVSFIVNPYPFNTPANYREMISIDGAALTGPAGTSAWDYDDIFKTGRTVGLSSYTIAKYETTYELWKEVYDWAIEPANGYTFTTGSGYEGHEEAGETPGTGTTDESHGWAADQKKRRPVTYISWQDAVVWCNAYSKMSGKEPVYYADNGYSTVLKDATNTAMVDIAKVKGTANGYRLPIEAEWEYAARGADFYGTFMYAGSDTIGDVAWYEINSCDLGENNEDYGVHQVGTKNANGKDLYDMSGNVWEWCWDWYTPSNTINSSTPDDGPALGTERVYRGGSWFSSDSSCGVAFRNHYVPGTRTATIGFRVVCSF